MNNQIYQRVAAVLVAANVAPTVRADVDAIFHGDETVGAQAAASGGYDSSKYPVRGSGMDAWNAAGRPPYDVAGRELDSAGFPTGNMKDGSSATAGTGGDPPADLVGGSVTVVLQTPQSIQTVAFNIPTAGSFWLETGEQPDQNWTISQADKVLKAGFGSSEEANPFQLIQGPGTLTLSFNAAAVSQEQLDERLATVPFQGVSRAHYTLHPK